VRFGRGVRGGLRIEGKAIKSGKIKLLSI